MTHHANANAIHSHDHTRLNSALHAVQSSHIETAKPLKTNSIRTFLADAIGALCLFGGTYAALVISAAFAS